MFQFLKKSSFILVFLSLSLFGSHEAVAASLNCKMDCAKPQSACEWFGEECGKALDGDNEKDTVKVITDAIRNEINAHETWMVKFLFEDNILPAMQMMAEQLTAVALQQVQIIGSFFDAKQQMETQRTLQKLQAEAHKDYHPSVGMCEFGSSVKSLAASERRGEYNALVLGQRSIDRQLGNANSAGAAGTAQDKQSRLDQFRETYCSPYDNNNGLWVLCYPDKSPPSVKKRKRFNKDIDFARTVDYPWTLEVDFTDESLLDEDGNPNDEEDIIALSNNLFGHEIFNRIPAELLKLNYEEGSDIGSLNNAHKALMDMRALVAKRNVAENSFNALIGMKSEGTGGSTEYLQAILKELGIGDGGDAQDNLQDLEEMLGENPSYYAQMEVLTKKIYQNPDFYTNLYDKPANVLRKEAALQAIGLMQKFDTFKSHLRSEANLSILLELALTHLQSGIEDDLTPTRTEAVETSGP